MPKHTQISIAMRNEVGSLCRLCGIMARAGVNILGLAIDDCTDEGFVRLIVDEPKKARQTLDAARVPHQVQDVLALDLANEPGALQRASARLAEAGVNIHYAYGTVGPQAGAGLLVLRVSDLDRAAAILEPATK
ncbi:MAG: hypothetical protein FJ288_01130 [Planctomycetes bacterium]|nr:hypothetical protein [Planctomycetota bacterium]